MGQAYATAPDYYARFANRTSQADASRVERALESASRWIDHRADQYFTRDAEPVERIWIGDGSPCLKVCGGEDMCPGIATASELEILIDRNNDGDFSDETELAATDFELRPLAAPYGPQPRPYREIVLPGYSGATAAIWPRNLRIKVKAVYGWPEVPAGIVAGCIELAGILLGDSPLASRTYTDMGTVGASLEARQIVREQIDVYRRTPVAVA